jgi:hypothetical protein
MHDDIRSLCHSTIAMCFASACGAPESALEVRTAPPIERVENEPPARLFVDPPLAEPLSQGRVVIQYRIEHLHVAPVFGPAALAVSPRVGHVHVSVDDLPWVWVDASGEPLVIVGLRGGRHKVVVRAQTANHQQLDEAAVEFTVPETSHRHRAPEPVERDEPSPRILLDPPAAEPLALRGVVFLRYRTEHVQLVPVFGPEALAISPRVGHVHVTVDDAAWHWADASGDPIVIGGLPPGPHTILVELANANHSVIDRGTVEVVVPATGSH